MSIASALRKHVETLQKLYEENLEAVKNLQRTLSHEVLPGIIDELELNAEDQTQAEEYLQDTLSIFRILRKHKFTSSFALEALRTNLIWRCRSLPPLDVAPPSPFLHCLPVEYRDPFGLPIAAVQLSELVETTDDLRPLLLRNAELLRMHLSALDASKENTTPLQFVVLLDVKDVPLSCVAKYDILTWCLAEVLPHFPGMISAVFIINYSWAYSGLWNLSKRTLPTAALSRIFFPTQEELLEYFAASSVPKEYGGDAPLLSELPDPLHRYIDGVSATRRDAIGQPEAPIHIPSTREETTKEETQKTMSPFSLLNPYFGYPVIISAAATPSATYHVRRTKRDLLRTLFRLFWLRWRKQLTATSYIALILCAVVALHKVRGSVTWMRRWQWPISSASALVGLILQLPLAAFGASTPASWLPVGDMAIPMT